MPYALGGVLPCAQTIPVASLSSRFFHSEVGVLEEVRQFAVIHGFLEELPKRLRSMLPGVFGGSIYVYASI